MRRTGANKYLTHEADVSKTDPVTRLFLMQKKIFFFKSKSAIHVRNCKEISGVEFLQHGKIHFFIAAKSTPQNFFYIFCPISPDDKVTGQVCYYATEQCNLNL